MDEKTEELRDIFMDVSEEGTVTERQEESPGTLANEEPEEDRIAELIARMRDRYSFRCSVDRGALVEIARRFYWDQSDAVIADALDLTEEEVFRARLDLHLLKDADRTAPFDFQAFRRSIISSDAVPDSMSDLDPDVRERYRAVVEAEQEMWRANYRFRDQFDDIIGDGDIAAHLTKEVTDDGLEDATEGIEIDTGF